MSVQDYSWSKLIKGESIPGRFGSYFVAVYALYDIIDIDGRTTAVLQLADRAA